MAYAITQSLNLVNASTQYGSSATTYGLTSWQAFTVEAWVKLNTNPASGLSYEVATIGWATIGARLRVTNLAGGGMTIEAFRHAWGIDTTFLRCAFSFTFGQWYHLAFTKDGSNNGKLYLNGVLVGSAALGAGTGNTVSVLSTVGVGYDNGAITATSAWDGRISLHRVWNSAKTQQELSVNRCNVFGAATTGMVAEHSLDNVYTDASGGLFTLTATGTPTFAGDVPGVCGPRLGDLRKNNLRPKIFTPGRAR